MSVMFSLIRLEVDVAVPCYQLHELLIFYELRLTDGVWCLPTNHRQGKLIERYIPWKIHCYGGDNDKDQWRVIVCLTDKSSTALISGYVHSAHWCYS